MSSKPQPNADKDGAKENAVEDSAARDSSKGGSESRQALPFEPTKNRKQAEKASKRPAAPPVKAEKSAAAKPAATQANRSTSARSLRAAAKGGSTAQETAIPDAVSRRMIKRMALLCGIPSALGMATFVVSYLLVANDLFEVPTYAVLLVSLGWFGLGVLGLSYGVLSASWDEEIPGSWAGWDEFTTNWGRMTAAWRSSKNKT